MTHRGYTSETGNLAALMSVAREGVTARKGYVDELWWMTEDTIDSLFREGVRLGLLVKSGPACYEVRR